MAFDGLEVALALAQQPQFRQQDVAVGNAISHWESRINQLPQLGEPGDRLANQRKSAEVGQGFMALPKAKSRGFHMHRLGELRWTSLYHYKQLDRSYFRSQ